MTEPFIPTWASPPGDTILDLLEERGWTQLELAERAGFTKKHVNDLVHGRATLSADAAERIARVLGSTVDFWLVREAQYRAALERVEATKQLAADAPWLRELPLGWMTTRGLVSKASSKGAQVDACLRYFGVASVEVWRDHYEKPLVAYRASPTVKKKIGAVAAWLRETERQAESTECAPFDAAGLRATLTTIRAWTATSDLSELRQTLATALAAHGVALVIAPAPPGCPVSGATRWLTPQKALLALTVRYKTNDHFWFTVFHEAGHILLHKKRLDFVEGIDGLDPEVEEEADRFARDLLIPPHQARQLRGLLSRDQVVAAAKTIGVAPGVVVGRMQKEGWIEWSHLNALKAQMTPLD